MYYLLYTLLFSLGSVGYLYFFNKRVLKKIITISLWNIMKFKCYLDHHFSKFKSSDQNIHQDTNISPHYFHVRSQIIENIYNNENYEITSDDINYYFTDNKDDADNIEPLEKMKELLTNENIIYYCKTINDKCYFYRLTHNTTSSNLINMETIEKPFIQIELEQNNSKIDIGDNLECFYIKNNIILDNIFLKWFIYYYYDEKLLDTYKLHIIDKDANIITMDNSDGEICNKIIL
tara:strand:- start:5745 stop:6446 length:702 start_codon:yes stop_codon:yes gene_type:complete